jgi:diacylglycerol O-acyltransferase / wax synthase
MTADDHQTRPREQRFEQRMSDAEALMWNVEKDPWLNPSGGMVTICDRPIDYEQFRHRMRNAALHIPRLRQRVVPGFGRLSTPAWSFDAEFDFDYHIRRITLPAPGTRRDLLDLATRLYEDPFDRTRPLWLFVVIDGLDDGRGALFWKTHHSISDGIGMIRLSELYMERKREAPLPPDVDLDAVVAESIAPPVDEPKEQGGDRAASLRATATKSIAHVWRRQAGIARRVLGELALWPADPQRVVDAAEGVVGSVRSTVDQVRGGGDVAGGSPLWKERSRRRHLEGLRINLEHAKAAGKTLGGSVNDFFVTGAIMGALAYHAERKSEVDALNISFVVSTRTDTAAGGNSFTPTRVQIPGGAMPAEERFAVVRKQIAAKRAGVRGAGAMSNLAGVANLLPTSVVTRVARSQAAKMDFATSNLRAAPFPMYISGAEVLENITMGPVAGTAFNLTAISYNGSLDMGVFIDPAAVEDPAGLRRNLEQAYQHLLEAGGIVTDESQSVH